jgi:hypothetical protein
VGCAGATAPPVLTAKEFAMVVCQLRIVHITDDDNHLQQRLEPRGVTRHRGCICHPREVSIYMLSISQLLDGSSTKYDIRVYNRDYSSVIEICNHEINNKDYSYVQ